MTHDERLEIIKKILRERENREEIDDNDHDLEESNEEEDLFDLITKTK